MKTLILLLLLQLAATSAPQTPTPSEAGTIQGTVKREGTTEFLSNAQVTLEGGSVEPQVMQLLLNTAASQGIVVTPQPGASTSEIVQQLADAAAARGYPLTTANIQSQLSSLSGKTPPTTTTDRDGNFTFSDVRPGKYTVRVQRDGYFGKPEGGVYPATAAVDATVTSKQTAKAELSMIPGAIMGGRIFGADGQVMSNANVQAFIVLYQSGFAVMVPLVSKVTDDRGEFRLFWVPPGEYYLGVSPRPAVATPGAVAPPPAIKTFYPGTPTLSEAKVITIRGGEDMSGMDIGIRVPRSFRISGQVNNLVPPPAPTLGQPAAVNAAVLMLVGRDVNTPDDAGARQIGVVPLLPSTGKFDVPNIPPGSYDLFARTSDPSAQVAGGQPLAWGRARIDIRDSDVDNIAIVVSQAVEVKGTVSATGGAKIPNSIRVQLSPDGGAAKVPAYQLISIRSATVTSEGTFTVPVVPEGRFRVGTVAGLPPELYLADVRQNGQSVFDTGFDVGNKSPDPIEVVIGAGAGTIEGLVLESPLKPSVGATVALIPESRKRENRALYLAANTDASGRFRIRGVAPGTYKVFAWENVRAFAFQNPAFLARYEENGKSVTIGQNGTANVEITVIPAIEKK